MTLSYDESHLALTLELENISDTLEDQDQIDIFAQEFPYCPVQIGGFSDIYRYPSNGAHVALKVLRCHGTSWGKEKVEMKLRRELSIWRRLSHPNILPFIGLSQTNVSSMPILVSPWQENGNIRQYLANSPNANRLQLVLGVADAMMFIHSQGIVHGNIHPGNILIDDSGSPLISDIAISKVYTKLNLPNDTLELSHARYMAPEYINDSIQTPTLACDVYSFGSTCFEILSDNQPFSHCRSSVEVVLSLYAGEYPFGCVAKPVLEPPDLNQEFWDLVMWCWVIEPHLRPNMLHIHNILKNINLQTIKPSLELQARL